jgi:predicted O-methyltransferase YrrM
MSLTKYLLENGMTEFEGNTENVKEQQIELIRLSKDVKTAMEIGFNAGHSAELFLKNNPDLTLTSFDIGDHDYVLRGKQYIDKTFPGRHTLIIGDSTMSVPKFIKDHPETKFDLLFIDGCHEFDIAKADLENCKHLAHKDSIFIMDDTIFSDIGYGQWNIGPTKAVTELHKKGLLINIKAIDFIPGRGMTIGNYNLDNL